MLQLVVVTAAAIGLIVFVSFVAARLVRARTSGLSIRMQIFIALALIVGAFAFGLGLMVLDRIKARADLVSEEAAAGEARAVAALIAGEMESRGASLADVANRLTRQSQAGQQLQVSLFDGADVRLFSSGRAVDAPGTVSASATVMVNGQPQGRVQVAKPTLIIQQTLADFAPTILVISLLLGAVAAGAAALIGGTIASPIEQLTRYAERVSQGDRRAPPPLGHGREVMRLTNSLDSMRRELQGRPFVETFAADLSHELKNPVAAIRATGEVLRDGALAEPEQAERFVARILEATGRIESLLGDLLSLAGLEARGVEEAETVDLAQQAREAVLAAQQQGDEVALLVEGTPQVRGDAAWLRRAITNLLDNARLHGNGGTVSVKLFREGDEVCCHVSNPGHIGKAMRKRMFRRFVTTRADRGGTGLGLAIVRAIAEAHGGQAKCADFGPPQVTFELRLPVSHSQVAVITRQFSP